MNGVWYFAERQLYVDWIEERAWADSPFSVIAISGP
jgi:hypothetical protein